MPQKTEHSYIPGKMSSKISTPFQQEDNKIQSWRPGSKFYGLIPADKEIKRDCYKPHESSSQVNVPLKGLMTSFFVGCGGVAFFRDKFAVVPTTGLLLKITADAGPAGYDPLDAR
jgi:hypothetical protein